jgi:hypothetical protein
MRRSLVLAKTPQQFACHDRISRQPTEPTTICRRGLSELRQRRKDTRYVSAFEFGLRRK